MNAFSVTTPSKSRVHFPRFEQEIRPDLDILERSVEFRGKTAQWLNSNVEKKLAASFDRCRENAVKADVAKELG